MTLKNRVKRFLDRYGFGLAVVLAFLQIFMVSLLSLKSSVPYLEEAVVILLMILSILVLCRCYIMSKGMKIRQASIVLAVGIGTSYFFTAVSKLFGFLNLHFIEMLLFILPLVQALGFLLFAVQIFMAKQFNGKPGIVLVVSAVVLAISILSTYVVADDLLFLFEVGRLMFYPALALALRKVGTFSQPLIKAQKM